MYSEQILSNKFRQAVRIERRPYMPNTKFTVVRIYPTGWMQPDDIVYRGNDEQKAISTANHELSLVSQ